MKRFFLSPVENPHNRFIWFARSLFVGRKTRHAFPSRVLFLFVPFAWNINERMQLYKSRDVSVPCDTFLHLLTFAHRVPLFASHFSLDFVTRSFTCALHGIVTGRFTGSTCSWAFFICHDVSRDDYDRLSAIRSHGTISWR